jgi:6-phosphogluconolactonase
MLDHLPVDPDRVHAMAASDGEYGDDVDAAAAAYAEELRRAAGGEAEAPAFDVLMLGIGPDAHVASVFPGHPVLTDERPVAGVRNSPKPPPTRITLTMQTLRRAREVWFVAAGPEKAEAVRLALAGADVPAAGPKGTERTLWFLDPGAASAL